MVQRRSSRSRKRSKPELPPDEMEFYLVLDTMIDAQRDVEQAARRVRARMCHEVGELLAHRLAHQGWTRETLARLSGFLAHRGVAPELATPASLVRMTRIVELEKGLVDDRGLAPVFTPMAAGPQSAADRGRSLHELDIPFGDEDEELERVLAGEAWLPANA